MSFTNIIRLTILVYGSSFILLITGALTLPTRPEIVMVGDTRVSGMTDGEYTEFVLKSAPFRYMMAGIALFMMGIALLLYLKKHNYGVSEPRVVPYTSRMDELAHKFNKVNTKDTGKGRDTSHVTFDIV